MNIKMHKNLCEKYEIAARNLVAEHHKYKNGLEVTMTASAREYKNALQNLREFLDQNGLFMPKPKWLYDHNKESTWMYSYREECAFKPSELRKNKI